MPEHLSAEPGAFSPTDVGKIFREVDGTRQRFLTYDSLTDVTVERISALSWYLDCARWNARQLSARIMAGGVLAYLAVHDWVRECWRGVRNA